MEVMRSHGLGKIRVQRGVGGDILIFLVAEYLAASDNSPGERVADGEFRHVLERCGGRKRHGEAEGGGRLRECDIPVRRLIPIAGKRDFRIEQQEAFGNNPNDFTLPTPTELRSSS